MGRKKSDSPTIFPWDKLFSSDEKAFNEGIEYCLSEYSGSDNLKRAVTTIGSGYNSGSKPVLCDRIKIKANQIRYQLNKVESNKREEMRKQVIEFYTQTFLKKFEGKEPGIVNIVIPARPILPSLNEQEKRRFASPPSSPRSSPPSSPRSSPLSQPIDEDILPPLSLQVQNRVSKKDVNDGVLLSARAILYYKGAPTVNGKKSLSAKSFYEQLLVLYAGVVPEDSALLNKELIKNEIKQIPEIIKASGGILKKETIERAEAVVKKSEKMSKYKKAAPIVVEVDEEEILHPLIEEEILPPRVAARPQEPQEYKSSVNEDDIMNYIKTKGWEEPKYKSKEALCDYMLTKIKTEDIKSETEYKTIEGRIEKLSSDLISLIDMHEERLKELEKVKTGSVSKTKKGKKVTFGQNQIKIIEEEKEEIEQQIHDVKEQLKEAEETKDIIVQQIEEKKQMCFRMRQWLDQDDFDRVEAEKDLTCDTGLCNVESGYCEPSQEGDNISSIGIAKIKGSKDLLDRMVNKYNKVVEPIEEPEEIIVPPPVVKEKKAKIPSETLREQIKLILSTSDLDIVTNKDIIKQLTMLFRVKFDKRKDEIEAIATEEIKKLIDEREPVKEEPTEQQIVEKTVEFLEAAGKKINEKDIRAKVGEFFDIDIEPHKKLIKSTVKKFVEDKKSKRKRCNTIPLEQEVDEETRAQDLMCDEGDACNLDESRCDPIEEFSEPVEELTIGGMLVKVSGKNKIIEALKEKIRKSGGAVPIEEDESGTYEPEEELPEMAEEELPFVEPEQVIEEPKQSIMEPTEPTTPLKEVIQETEEVNDVFQSNLPGIRISLEDLVKGIKSITKSTSITSAQNKIKSAERKCIDRIAKCAGIKL